MRKVIVTALAIVSCLAMLSAVGCAPGSHAPGDVPDGDPAGFWRGLWHGFIAMFTFVISLFSDSVRMYEVHNSGRWYDLGFLLGAVIFFGGGGATGRGSCRKA
jgi:hypothetical protein